MSKKLKILNGEEIEECRDVTSLLWRTLVFDLTMSAAKWNNLMLDYLEHIKLMRPEISKEELKEERVSTNRSLLSFMMTFKVFMKGLRFLGTEKATLEVVAQMPDGTTSQVSTVLIGPLEPPKAPPPGAIKRQFRRFEPTTILRRPKSMYDILEASPALLTPAKGGLSRLWRQLVFANHMSLSQWEALMNHLIEEKLHGLKESSLSNIPGNLNKELALSDMSIKVFMKGLRLLRVESFTLNLTLKRADSLETTWHTIDYKTPTAMGIYQKKPKEA